MDADQSNTSSEADCQMNSTVCCKEIRGWKFFPLAWWSELKSVVEEKNKQLLTFVTSLFLIIGIIGNMVGTVDYYNYAFKDRSEYSCYHLNNSDSYCYKNKTLHIQNPVKLSDSYFFCTLGVWIPFPVLITTLGYSGDKYGPIGFLTHDVVGNGGLLGELDRFLMNRS